MPKEQLIFKVKGETMSRPYLLSLLALATLYVPVVNGQNECVSPAGCTNPVPATDISYQPPINTWQDTYSDTWNITSTSGSVSGSVVVPFPPGCSSVTFTVSGSITPSVQTDGTQGSTAFTFNASSPSPSGTCGGETPVPFTFSGTIQNNGNDYAPNTTWMNSIGGGGGTTTMTKSPSDIPTSETTRAVGFGTGYYTTVGQFRQDLNAASGSGDIFQGRQVFEATGFGTNYDSCWYSGSPTGKITTVSGGAWNVGYYAVNPPYILTLNEWVDDYIGWLTGSVTDYQAHWSGGGSPLCGFRLPQAMYIAITGTSGSSQNYVNDTLGQDIYSDHVTSIRAGVNQSANWP